MEKKNNFLTFILALIPGVGYMYLGLLKKGVQVLALFFLIEPILSLLSLESFETIFKVPFWFYVFFDTLNTARRMDRGEYIPDTDFILKKYINEDENIDFNNKIGKKIWFYIGWALIIIGSVSVIDKIFEGLELYSLIKSYISIYFFPVLFILIGIYLIIKNKNF